MITNSECGANLEVVIRSSVDRDGAVAQALSCIRRSHLGPSFSSQFTSCSAAAKVAMPVTPSPVGPQTGCDHGGDHELWDNDIVSIEQCSVFKGLTGAVLQNKVFSIYQDAVATMLRLQPRPPNIQEHFPCPSLAAVLMSHPVLDSRTRCLSSSQGGGGSEGGGRIIARFSSASGHRVTRAL